MYIADADMFFSPTLIERFDLVGMDPRGIENSSQVRCSLPVITPDSTLFPKSEQQFQQLRQHNRKVGLNCLDKVSTGPSSLSTRQERCTSGECRP
jgi:hypothetical protein